MKCEDCENPAIVHTSVVVEGDTKQEIHLCRECAEKRKLIVANKPNLPAIVKQSLGHVGLLATELARSICPDCGISYMEFRKQGRLGCPYDYVVFRAGVRPLLDRVHRATHHTGKRPRTNPTPVEAHADARGLRHELKLAVQGEEFERAAELRDRIRLKECGHGA